MRLGVGAVLAVDGHAVAPGDEADDLVPRHGGAALGELHQTVGEALHHDALLALDLPGQGGPGFLGGSGLLSGTGGGLLGGLGHGGGPVDLKQLVPDPVHRLQGRQAPVADGGVHLVQGLEADPLEVINLPAGATPIDFAYSIHSAIGNTMVGAKINGRMVGFDYQLHNGDVVEINTSKSAHGPSRDWMKIAKSSEARSKIRQWFKRERREENIAQGRASFEAELKHVGLTMSQITASDVLPSILKRVSFQSL